MSAPTLDRTASAVAATAPRPPAPHRPPHRPRLWLLQTATAASLLGALLVGFAGYLFGVSGFQEEHTQSTYYKTLRYELGNALAPTGAADDGSPVAVLDIPAIGVRSMVVVEGTTGRDLMRGPGHRRDTALPGQNGTSVLYGRRATVGAPFAHLSALRVGDKIHVTTGQGKFTYTVDAYGSDSHPITTTAPARLTLATANSAWVPTHTMLVGARLDGAPQMNPGGRPAVIPADRDLASDTSALVALQLWSLALLMVACLVTAAVRLWDAWAAYVVFAPVLGALIWCVYENAAALLPNLY